jgi:hypothetical protein
MNIQNVLMNKDIIKKRLEIFMTLYNKGYLNGVNINLENKINVHKQDFLMLV